MWYTVSSHHASAKPPQISLWEVSSFPSNLCLLLLGNACRYTSTKPFFVEAVIHAKKTWCFWPLTKTKHQCGRPSTFSWSCAALRLPGRPWSFGSFGGLYHWTTCYDHPPCKIWGLPTFLKEHSSFVQIHDVVTTPNELPFDEALAPKVSLQI